MTETKTSDGVSAMVSFRLLGFATPRVKSEYRKLSFNALCDLEDSGVNVNDGINLHLDGLPDLLRKAEHNFIAFETLRLLAILLMREGIELPPVLRTWVAAFLDGSIRPLKKSGQHPWKNCVRDIGICCEVYRLIRDQGMTASRNREPNVQSTPQSACDVVAERHGMSFTAVAKIWQRYAHLR